MVKESIVPFKVGDMAEARSFQKGYRGAWFRCKIRQITSKGLVYILEYYDFPDEKYKSTKLYQLPPYCLGKVRRRDPQLMLRPCYPTIYNKNQLPPGPISEVAVVVDDTWKVGDLVDWWTTDCYWSGKIVQLLGDGKAQVELKPPPLGEGDTYEVLLKDLRPSLDWSPEHGWMVPTQDGDNGHPSVQILTPLNQVMNSQNACQGTEGSAISDNQKGTKTLEMQNRSSENAAPKELMNEDTQEQNTTSGFAKIKIESDAYPGETSERASEENLFCSCSRKKFSASEGLRILNTMESDPAEAAVLDLEEYLNKVKWLKAILLNEISVNDTPKWKFVDKNAPFQHK